MVQSAESLKRISVFSVFTLTLSGRLSCSFRDFSTTGLQTHLNAILNILTLSAVISLLTAYSINLFMISGSVQKNLKASRYTALYTIAHLILYNIEAGIAGFINGGLFLFLTLFLYRNHRRQETVSFYSLETNTGRGIRKRPLRRLLEAFFRLYPHPAPTGLRRIGAPGKGAALYITGNFSLTVRTVLQKLKELDCWVLICDSKGINIWCSSLSGHFNTDSILKEIKREALNSRISPGMAFIPQLSAAAVDPERVSNLLGIPVYFGPLRIRADLQHPQGPFSAADRTVGFPLHSRLEMALGAPLFSVLFSCLIYNFFAPYRLLFLIPLLYGGSLFQSLFLMNRLVGLKILICCSFHLLFLFLIQRTILPLSWFDMVFQVLLIGYLVFEYEGWSPLVKFGIGRNYGKITIHLDQKLCTRCGRCLAVCPKNVFALSHEGVVFLNNGQECVQCKSCVFQCPEKALTLNSS